MIGRLVSTSRLYSRATCQRSVKIGHFKESKTAPSDLEGIGTMGMSNVLKVSLQTTTLPLILQEFLGDKNLFCG